MNTPAAAVTAPPGNPRFPLFDSLRAIAALCVVTTHVSFLAAASYTSDFGGRLLSQLTIGVPIFFVISGFLLYRPFITARFRPEGPDVPTYARRRFLRIAPAYWAALTLLAVGPGLPGVLTGDWWLFYGFAQVYTDETALDGIPQAWSLCVEVTFYLVLPLYALAVGRLSRWRGAVFSVRVEMIVLGVLVAGCMAFRAYAHASEHLTLFLTLPATFDWFAIGMALAVASVAIGRLGSTPRAVELVKRHPGACWVAAVAVYVVMATSLDLPRGFEPDYTWAQRYLQHIMSGAVALLLLLPAVFWEGGGGRTRRLLAWPALAWLGTISYGIFLYNLRIAQSLKGNSVDDLAPSGSKFGFLLIATIAVSVAVAAVSYYVLERPLQRYKSRRPRTAGHDTRVAGGASS